MMKEHAGDRIFVYLCPIWINFNSVEVDRAPLFDIFVKNGGLKKGSVKLKHPEKLKEFLKTVRHIVDIIASTSTDPSLSSLSTSKTEEERVVLAQIIEVLEQHEFGGVYRKCILRYANEEGPVISWSA